MPLREVSSKLADIAAKARASKKLGIFLKIAISVGFVLALIWRFRNDIPSLTAIDRTTVAGAIGLLLLQPVLIGVRWWLLLRQYDSRSTFPSLAGVSWFSVFANQFLPAGLGGDAVRIYYARRLGNRLGAATASVLMDRILALVALVLLVVGLAPSLPTTIDRRLVFALGGLCAVCVVLIIGAYLMVRRSWHLTLQSPLIQRLMTLTHYVLRTLSYPLQTLLALSVSITVHLLSFAAFILIARSIGIAVATAPMVAVTALLTFIQIIPISIGGWGVREVAAVSLLGLLGVEPGSALLASLLLGFSYAVASLPGVAMWPFVKVPAGQSAHHLDAPVH